MSLSPSPPELRLAALSSLTRALEVSAQQLEVHGWLVGPDNHGTDRPRDLDVYGLSLLAAIAHELTSSALLLHEQDRSYAASALTRQLVEVEYLTWAFEHDPTAAREWIAADRSNRLTDWSPRALRERSNGRFKPRDYHSHCEIGGHPTTRGQFLLRPLSPLVADGLLADVANHAFAIWQSLNRAYLERHGQSLPEDPSENVQRWLNTVAFLGMDVPTHE